jgi:hypothetical protein
MNQIDELIRSLDDDISTDDEEHDAIEAARRALKAAIAAEQIGRSRKIRGKRIGRRRLALALVAAVAIIGVAFPAFGVVGDGWIGVGGEVAGVIGAADPKLTGPPVVVASGEPEEPWTIVIARSNQGVCLNVDIGDEQFSSERHRLGHCGYSDIRGDLPPDVRGDPWATCFGLTELVPCGSLPKYSIQYGRSETYVPEIRRRIFVGAAAADVASVELVLANGGTLDAEVVERPLGPDVPLNVYWAELGPDQGLRLHQWRNANGQRMPCLDVLVETVVARDSGGRVLGRRIPAWNGNPSGDPAGPPGPAGLRDTECV